MKKCNAPKITGMISVKPRAYKNFIKNLESGNNKAIKAQIKRGSVSSLKLPNPN